jgi:hypothetical protein
MRTIAVAAPPRPLLWQAAFTCETYTAQSPIIWQHVFVSDAPMTNWSAGSSRFLTWVAKNGSPVTFRENEAA